MVFGFLRGRTVATTMMAWTTVRCWLMRLGLYALLRPLEQANDWAYLIDHTVQIGTVKCFAVVGVRLSQLPYPRRCLPAGRPGSDRTGADATVQCRDSEASP